MAHAGVFFAFFGGSQAWYDGLTRLDRVMILPFDVVQDNLAFEEGLNAAESFLDRPVDMVFHCQTGWRREDAEEDDEKDEEEARAGSSTLDAALQVKSFVDPALSGLKSVVDAAVLVKSFAGSAASREEFRRSGSRVEDYVDPAG